MESFSMGHISMQKTEDTKFSELATQEHKLVGFPSHLTPFFVKTVLLGTMLRKNYSFLY